MKNYTYTLSFLLCIFLASCGPGKYVTKDYDRYAKSHRVIAILPYANTYTGRLPKDMSAEELLELQVEEAIVFQRSLYFQLLDRSGPKDKDIDISIQDVNLTNAKLKKANVTIEDSWTADPIELAKILEVDAVVRTNLRKDHLLSDGASLAIQTAATILDVVSTVPGVNSRNLSKTSDITIHSFLLDGDNGLPLWALDRKCPTDWNNKTDKVVNDVNNFISRKFPYRAKM